MPPRVLSHAQRFLPTVISGNPLLDAIERWCFAGQPFLQGDDVDDAVADDGFGGHGQIGRMEKAVWLKSRYTSRPAGVSWAANGSVIPTGNRWPQPIVRKDWWRAVPVDKARIVVR
jgi:hypothetical protein